MTLQIMDYATSMDQNLASFLTGIMQALETQRRGQGNVSLSNIDNNNKPAIKAGSWFFCAGSIIRATSDTAITDSAGNGTCYIKIIPDGAAMTATAELTNTEPVWRDSYQGWYSPTTGEENCVYLPFQLTKSGTIYSNKKHFFYHNLQKMKIDSAEVDSAEVNLMTHKSVGVLGFNTSGSAIRIKTVSITLSGTTGSVAHGISGAQSLNKILFIDGYVEYAGDRYGLYSSNGSSSFGLIGWNDSIIGVSYGTSGRTYVFHIVYYA